MKLKQIESHLSSVIREFPDPKVSLEQYPTSVELTASVVSFARDDGDLGPGISVLDLGCGTGMLAVGCALMECDSVLGLDCDPKALAVAQLNAEKLELPIDFIIGKVSDEGVKKIITKKNRNCSRGGRGRLKKPVNLSLDLNVPDGLPLRDNCVDTVITNPPFGTKHNAGLDVRFLKAATRLARRVVYSFHKTSTRDYLLRKVKADWGYEAKIVAEMKFDLPQVYKFHNKKSVDVNVDLLRIQISPNKDDNVDISIEEKVDY